MKSTPKWKECIFTKKWAHTHRKRYKMSHNINYKEQLEKIGDRSYKKFEKNLLKEFNQKEFLNIVKKKVY